MYSTLEFIQRIRQIFKINNPAIARSGQNLYLLCRYNTDWTFQLTRKLWSTVVGCILKMSSREYCTPYSLILRAASISGGLLCLKVCLSLILWAEDIRDAPLSRTWAPVNCFETKSHLLSSFTHTLMELRIPGPAYRVRRGTLQKVPCFIWVYEIKLLPGV